MGSLHARVIAQSAVDDARERGRRPRRRRTRPRRAVRRRLVPRTRRSVRRRRGRDRGLHGGALRPGPRRPRSRTVPLLVEKPVADGLEKTLEIIAAVRGSRHPDDCAACSNGSTLPWSRHAQLMDDPKFITATRHSPYAPRIRTGVSWDLLVHDVDLASIMLGGEPTAVTRRPRPVPPDVGPGRRGRRRGRAHVRRRPGRARLGEPVGQRKIRTMSIHDLDKLIEVDLLRRDVTIYRHVSDQPANAEGRGYRQQTVDRDPRADVGPGAARRPARPLRQAHRGIRSMPTRNVDR